MDKEQKKKKVIKNLKIAGLTGAVVAIGISLVGCGIPQNILGNREDNQIRYNEASNENLSSSSDVKNNYTSKIDSNESHNYLLYVNQNAYKFENYLPFLFDLNCLYPNFFL